MMAAFEEWYNVLESELPSPIFKELGDLHSGVGNDIQQCIKNCITIYVKLFKIYLKDEVINTKTFTTITEKILQNLISPKIRLQTLNLVLNTLNPRKKVARNKAMDLLTNVYINNLFLTESITSVSCSSASEMGDIDDAFSDKDDHSNSILDILLLVADWCNPDLYEEGKDITSLKEESIQHFKSQATSCLRFLHVLLCKLNESLVESSELSSIRTLYIYSLKKGAIKLYIACICNTGINIWTNNASMAHARNLQNQMCKSLQCPNISVLLTGPQSPLSSHSAALLRKGILADVLKIYKENFTSKNWRQHAALKHVLIFTITQVKYPFLGKEVLVIVPALLNLCDDFSIENRVLGISTLSFVISNVNASDLKIYNHADVLYDSLFRHVYNSENPVMEVLFPCLLQVVLVLEPKPWEIKTLNYRKIDHVMQQILALLEMEGKLVNRRTLLKNLKVYVNKLEITVIRHMKRLLSALFDCLKYYDGKEEEARILTLEVMECLVKKVGHLIKNHATDIVKNLIILLISINSSSENSLRTDKAKAVLHERCAAILITIRSFCGMDFQSNVSSIQRADVCGDCEQVKIWINNVLSQELSG